MKSTVGKSVLLTALGCYAGTALAGAPPKPGGTRNFIMIIPDGFGPASEVMARNYVHWKNNATVSLPIDEMLIGSVRTRSSDSYITDSASSATAYSCGIKTFNGAIGVDDDNQPCGTVLEAAKAQGYKTGLVVTSRLTHATPASYVAHVYDRDLESNIALQEIGYTHPFGPQVDLMMGGGRCYFIPQNQTGSCRKDEIDAMKLAEGLGYSVFSDRAGFDAKQKLPYLGLFTLGHMSYELDRDAKKEPSLEEMAIKALDDLYAATKKSEKGFFIMIEASRIDHAGHANDGAGHVHEILMYNKMMKTVTEWIDKHKDSPTLMLSTADHECGGLTLGVELDGPPEYWWAPEYIDGSSATVEVLAAEYKKYDGANEDGFLHELFTRYGVKNPTAEELAAAKALKGKSDFPFVLAEALNKRMGIHFSTRGHSAVDVSLFGYGKGHEQFMGSHENTEVAGFVTSKLRLNLDPITRKLQQQKEWIRDVVQPQPGELKKRAGGGLGKHHH